MSNAKTRPLNVRADDRQSLRRQWFLHYLTAVAGPPMVDLAMIASWLLSSMAMLFVPLAKGTTLTEALFLILQQLLGDDAATIHQINQVSLRQAITPERLGRVKPAEFFGLGAMLAGSLLGGLLGKHKIQRVITGPC
jgi:hypothetical protein